MALSSSKVLSLGAKGRLYSACGCTVMLYGSGTWSGKEEDVIRVDRNGARMDGQIYVQC